MEHGALNGFSLVLHAFEYIHATKTHDPYSIGGGISRNSNDSQWLLRNLLSYNPEQSLWKVLDGLAWKVDVDGILTRFSSVVSTPQESEFFQCRIVPKLSLFNLNNCWSSIWTMFIKEAGLIECSQKRLNFIFPLFLNVHSMFVLFELGSVLIAVGIRLRRHGHRLACASGGMISSWPASPKERAGLEPAKPRTNSWLNMQSTFCDESCFKASLQSSAQNCLATHVISFYFWGPPWQLRYVI